jgi:glutaredoxin
MTISAERPTVYWITGCGNCTRLKGYLMDRDVDFDDIDVQAHPGALEELEASGIRSFPIVRLGDQWATGLDLDQVNGLLGLTQDPAGRILSIDELVDRAAALLESTGRMAAQLPAEHLDDPTPTMDGFVAAVRFRRDGAPHTPHHSYRTLVYHLAGHGERFRRIALSSDGLHQLGFSCNSTAPDDTAYGEPVAATPMYMVVDWLALTAADLRAWSKAGGPRHLSTIIDTQNGPQTHLQLLQTHLCSLGQHHRQVQEVLVTRLRIQPDHPVGDEVFEGLLLPTSVWGS